MRKQVRIDFDHKTLDLKEIVELLDSIGYAPHIIFKDLDNPQAQASPDRSLYYKLGLAGFVFGNIMLFSFPEYLGLENDQGTDFKSIFAYLNLALILPVLLYSGVDYLKSAITGLKQGHLNLDVPISLGIWALFLRSAYDIISHSGPGYLDSLAGLIFFLLLGKWFQNKTFNRISFDRDFKSYFPIACSVIDGDLEVQKTLDKLKPGDRLILRHGELIPADGILMSGEAQVDYSFVTGESEAIYKNIGETLYAGGRQMGGIIEIVIDKMVSNSYLTQLWNDDAFTTKKYSGQTEKIANRIATIFTSVILLISFSSLIYWSFFDASVALNAFSSVLIIACPCAVALSIPFSFGNVIRILAARGIYLRNTGIVENLSMITDIVFDKTGTITSISASHVKNTGVELNPRQKDLIYSLARHSTHPLSRLIEKEYSHCNLLGVSNYIEEKGRGISGFVDGSLVRIGSAKFLDIPASDNTGADYSTYLEIENEIVGAFLQVSAYRKGLSALVEKLKQQYNVALLTGDNDREAATLRSIFGKNVSLHFRQSPQEKLNAIRKRQEDNARVLMIGDGLNDAGALRQSDVGIVISEDTSNFTPACDIVMSAERFEELNKLLQYASSAVRTVWFTYLVAAIYNIIGLSYAVQGLLSPVIAAVLMPLSSVTIVLIGTGLTTLKARKLGLFGPAPAYQSTQAKMNDQYHLAR